MPNSKNSRGHEQNHAHGEHSEFRLMARRNKLLGLWLAEQLGISDAEAYAKKVVISDLDEPGDEDVIRKVMADIAEKGSSISDQDIRNKLEACLIEATAQIETEV